jgi:cell division protein FtsI (penicillin-binding protein 3)
VDVKKDILWRVYLAFIVLVLFGFAIMGRVVQLQFVEGKKWRNLGDSLYKGIENRPAERGTIYSDDNEMLSSSIPFFKLHIDFRTPGLRAKSGKLFYDNVDSLSYYCSNLFGDRTKSEYKQLFTQAYKDKEPFFLFKEKLTYQQYFKVKNFPLLNRGPYKSGLITDVLDIRLNPFGLMANRTIGLSRDPKLNVGLEKYYDSVLRGQSGSRLVQYIAGGARVPVNGTEIEPINGKDVVTTLNTYIQDIVQVALHKTMKQNKAISGTAIVMEVATGKIKAIANLGVQKDSSYYEDNNYALIPSEPGSTIKLVTMLAGLEDGVIKTTDNVTINGGRWNYAGRDIEDAETSPRNELSYKEAFAHSSNVAMAKLAAINYSKNPNKFLKHFTNLYLDQKSGLDLTNPYKSLIKNTKSEKWSSQTLASMGFGYELRISPMQILMVYNAIANNAKLMKPYLVSDINLNGVTIKHMEPTVLNNAVCSKATLAELQQCLIDVCKTGTARKVFDSVTYIAAGKTGTTKVNDGTYNYDDKVYQSSFAGYFPADKPLYTCVVVIKNRPKAKYYMGGEIAAPVFKEIADKLVLRTKGNFTNSTIKINADSLVHNYKVSSADIATITKVLQTPLQKTNNAVWVSANMQKQNFVANAIEVKKNIIPNVVGMGLRDAIYCLENKGIKVKFLGRGKVINQDLIAGTSVQKNSIITLSLK